MVSQTIADLFLILFRQGASIEIIPFDRVPSPINLRLPHIQNLTIDSLYLEDKSAK